MTQILDNEALIILQENLKSIFSCVKTYSQFPNVKRVLIDPEAANKRAIHVYQKAGFKIIGEFIASWHPVPHYQMELYMEDLLNPPKKIGA